jgi:rhodanese-related sulfurtransferase
MQKLLFRALVLAFVAGGFAVAHSWNTGVLLHLKPQEEFDWAAFDAQRAADEAAKANAAAQQPPGGAGGSGADRQPDPAPVVVTPEPVRPQQQVEPSPGAGQAAQAAADSGNYVTVERARQLFDVQYLGSRQVVFIDARARDVFQKGHVENAMSLPAGELGPILPSKVRNYLTGAAVVIYCQGAECTDSHDVAKRLQAANIDISPIFIFKDGYPAWVTAGHPTMTGPEVGWE